MSTISFIVLEFKCLPLCYSHLHVGGVTHIGTPPLPISICSYSCPSPSPAEVPVSAPPGVNFGWHLQTAISTSTKMTVASRAVMMAVMTEARITDVELKRHSSRWVVIVVTSGVVGVEQSEPSH